MAAVVTYVLIVETGGNLTAADAFTVVAMYNLARFSLNTVPRAVRVSAQRKQKEKKRKKNE